MNVSYFFESIRTEFLDKLFLYITEFGGEYITYLFMFIVVWCMDYDFSRYFIIVNFYSIGTNIFLKNIFRIPRPWIIDPNFTVVDGAVEAATGYSFPSGHTATAVSVYGSFISWFKNKLVNITLIILIILISISRIYLGVHTIYDVLTSLVLGFLIILCLKCYLKNSRAKDKYLTSILFACIYSVICVVVLIFINNSIDSINTANGLKNAYTILGLSFGYLFSYLINIKYNTKSSVVIQFIKVILGALIVILIKEGTKYLFELILPGKLVTAAFRYFMVVVFAVKIWPMTFSWFNELEFKFRSLKNAKS